jgi:hypothetical protein
MKRNPHTPLVIELKLFGRPVRKLVTILTELAGYEKFVGYFYKTTSVSPSMLGVSVVFTEAGC